MKSEGICSYCKITFSGSVMSRHLQACAERKKQTAKDNNSGEVFLIHARCDPYWIYFEANADSTLKDVDAFLRDLWLECCGNMSMFTINNADYASSLQKEHGDKNMNVSLDKVLSPGMGFIHEQQRLSKAASLKEK